MIDENYPQSYDKEKYISWHVKNFKDNNLEKNIDNLMKNLKEKAHDNLELLDYVLKYHFKYCKNEYGKQKNIPINYETPLMDSLINGSYDDLFKSKESILNKLWRKNKNNQNVNLTNIKRKITDLVRTEVIAPTLDSAKFLAEHLESIGSNIYNKKLAKKCANKIRKICFEPEMKMESGYFAYHVLIYFKNDIVVELQIYSALMKEWRRLSHKIYEESRGIDEINYKYGTKESKLISLGHLLHLAECQLEQLQNQIITE